MSALRIIREEAVFVAKIFFAPLWGTWWALKTTMRERLKKDETP